jgi:hypothetical protein
VDHHVVLDAFVNIQDKQSLAWTILDHKGENAVTAAIVASANRRAAARIAHIEYYRVDMAFVEGGSPVALYQAKAAYLTDFQPSRVENEDWCLGRCVDEDLMKKPKLYARVTARPNLAALFYLYEIADPSKQLKYGKHPAVRVSKARAALRRLVTKGRMRDWCTLDCGTVDETNVKIHLAVFERRRRPAY